MKLNETGIWLGGAVGLILTMAVAFSSFQYLSQMERNKFQEQASRIDQQLSNYFGKLKESIQFAAMTLDASGDPQHVELLLTEDMQTVVYAPMLKHPERSAFVSRMQEDGFIDFQIKDGLQAASIHPAYLPITRVEPFNVENTRFLGIDLLNREDIHQVIIDAAVSSDLTVSEVALKGGQASYWVFKAIYSGFLGKGDSYFSKHKMDMFNGVVGFELSLPQLLTDELLASGMHISLTLEDGALSITTQDNDGQEFLHTSKQFFYPFDASHYFHLRIDGHIAWSNHMVLLLILVMVIGIAITWLLMRSSYVVIQSDLRRKNILQSSFEGILTFNASGEILDANPSAFKMFYPLTDIKNKKLYEMIHFPLMNQMQANDFGVFLLKHQDKLLNQPIELATILHDKPRLFECSITDFHTSSERQFTMFFRDITERKFNEEELVKLATIVEQSFNGIILTDCEGCIRYVNPAFEKISGFSSQEVMGKNPNIVKSDQHSKSYYKQMWKALTQGESWKGGFVNKAKDGHLYEVEQTIFPIYSPQSGELIGYTSIQQDVTERNRIQKQDEHAQRLESLGVLAGGIAHDFNNLLTAIMGNAGLAMRMLDEPEKCKDKLSNILNASDSAANLCKQMLAYSGKGQFIIHPVHLSKVTQKIVQLLQTSIHKKAKLTLDLRDDLPLVEADEGQMQQVIMNLVINAAEAMGEAAGDISVITDTVDLSKEDLLTLLNGDAIVAGKYVVMHVRDNGCGMDDETQKKIFDPFFTTKFTGRGLGMSAILGIIRAHQGALKVESVLGEGTLFSIYFPVVEGAIEQPLQHSVDDQHSQQAVDAKAISTTVLVVDDEQGIRDLATAILNDAGIQVMQAESGETGLSLLREHVNEIDVILLDMTMPNMDGKQFYIKMQDFASHIPVIISSGYSEHDIRKRFEVGMSLNLVTQLEFLQKPYFPLALQQKVQDILKS